MSALYAGLRGILGLFIDDAGLAVWAALAIAAMTIATKLGLIAPLWGALGLALGCAAALAASLVQAARRSGRGTP